MSGIGQYAMMGRRFMQGASPCAAAGHSTGDPQLSKCGDRYCIYREADRHNEYKLVKYPSRGDAFGASFNPADRPDRSGRRDAMDPLRNKLLANLSRSHLDLVLAKTVPISFGQGDVVQDEDEEIDSIYFPLSGMLSLLVVMSDGQTIETSVVGRECALGCRAGFGLYISRVRAVAQLPLEALRISAPDFRKLVANNLHVRDLCLAEMDALMYQARITAACNSRHVVESRFCRWLLHTADRAESDHFALTQELLSVMLGVRRTSVTDVASAFQKRGIIQYSRGKMQILDRRALERAACECYETLKRN